jgi:hypothetical protein
LSSGDDEFVEFVNNLETALILDGWTLRDEIKERHRFPPGSLLPPGCAVVVFGGGELQGAFGGSLVQAASSGGLLLNNDGDSIFLLDLTATIVISYTYGTEGGDDQSLTRYPDVDGPEPLVKHFALDEAGGRRFSPGVQIDGSVFPECTGAAK